MTELSGRSLKTVGQTGGWAACDPAKKCRMCGRIVALREAGLVARRGSSNRKGADEHEVRWTTCSECRIGLRAYLGTLKVAPRTLRRISRYASVHVRIGELLKAFGVGNRTPPLLIESMAGQRSWKSRLRELRQPPFNWKITPSRYKDSLGRTKCDYVLLEEGRWPVKPRRAARERRKGEQDTETEADVS
jgi:hypothetical protein